MFPQLSNAGSETLSGTVERITYYSPDSGYCVMRVRSEQRVKARRQNDYEDEDGLITVVGVMAEYQPGETLRLSGNWTTHPEYGKQFKAETVTPVAPTTLEGIKRYLGGGLIKGVGMRTAERIVSHFGEKTLDVLDQNPQLLHEVHGLKENAVDQIIEAWTSQRTIRDVMVFLQSHGITTGLAVKIYKTYGNEAVGKVRSNPYQLARDVAGIGFRTADKIARDMGVPLDAPNRLAAGVVFALEEQLNNGNVYVPRAELVTQAAELLRAEPEQVDVEIPQLQAENAIMIETVPRGEETVEAVYLPAFYMSEVGAARRLQAMAHDAASVLIKARDQDWEKFFAELLADNHIQLTDQQQDAVKAVARHKVSILTGGPGTGKTTTTRAIIKLFEEAKVDYALASPTGRAAKRLGEATGRAAYTIHRLLGYSPQMGFAYDENNPLDIQALIVDEASMIDLTLFYHLLKALKPETHLLLVGDVDQLPSVGAGDVLRDVIGSGVAHVTRLNVIFRQSETSLIVANAHRINHGQLPETPNKKDTDFFMFRIDDPDEAAGEIVDLVKNRIPKQFNFRADRDIQVIAPMYRGSAGVQALNAALQTALNPPGRAAERRMFGAVYRVGDRVMQTRNDYEKDVYNGDIGRIDSIDPQEEALTVIFDGHYVDYMWDECDALTHAFCISTHKSQGSEYPVVVMPLLTQHYVMLQRNLLYTAITRARQMVVLVGSMRALTLAVQNDHVAERYSGLCARLR
ncbi:MAG: SF1B family DNA helicase RecD2 [Aggregatilineales bacterium]